MALDETHAHLRVVASVGQAWSDAWPDVDPFGTAEVTVTMPTPVSGITVSPHEATLRPGEAAQLTATVTPSDATDKTIYWGSEDESIATVDQNGLVTAVASGTTTITVIADDGWFTDEATITVLPAITPTPGPVPQTGDPTLGVTLGTTVLGLGLAVAGIVLARMRVEGR